MYTFFARIIVVCIQIIVIFMTLIWFPLFYTIQYNTIDLGPLNLMAIGVSIAPWYAIATVTAMCALIGGQFMMIAIVLPFCNWLESYDNPLPHTNKKYE